MDTKLECTVALFLTWVFKNAETSTQNKLPFINNFLDSLQLWKRVGLFLNSTNYASFFCSVQAYHVVCSYVIRILKRLKSFKIKDF